MRDVLTIWTGRGFIYLFSPAPPLIHQNHDTGHVCEDYAVNWKDCRREGNNDPWLHSSFAPCWQAENFAHGQQVTRRPLEGLALYQQKRHALQLRDRLRGCRWGS